MIEKIINNHPSKKFPDHLEHHRNPVQDNLKEDWIETTIGEVADYLNGRGFKKSEWETKGLPIIRIQNLNKLDAPFNFTQKKI